MTKSMRGIRTLLAAVFVFSSGSVLAADESSETAGTSSPGVVVKVKKAIEHGARATAHGIERGANATARGIKRGATATRNAAHKVADKLTGGASKTDAPAEK